MGEVETDGSKITLITRTQEVVFENARLRSVKDLASGRARASAGPEGSTPPLEMLLVGRERLRARFRKFMYGSRGQARPRVACESVMRTPKECT